MKPAPMLFPLAVLLLWCTEVRPDAPPQAARTDATGDPLPRGVHYRLGTTRLRHWYSPRLQFTPDGKQLLSCGVTPDLMVWDVATGALLRTQPADAFPAAVSPDGRLAASVDRERATLRQWPDGKPLHHLPAPSLMSLAFSRDGETLTGLSQDSTVYRWEVAAGKLQARRHFALAKRAYAGDPPALLSPDGEMLVGVLKKDTGPEQESFPLRFWDVATGKECRPRIAIRNGSLWDLRWSPDSERLFVQLKPYTVEVWDVRSGKKVDAGGRGLGLEMARVEIRTPDPEKGKDLQIKRSQEVGAETVEMTPDGTGLLLGMFGSLALYDVKAKAIRWRRRVAPFASGPGLKYSTVTSFAFRPAEKTVAVGCSCGHIALLDWTTGKDVGFSRRHPGFFADPVFSPDGSLLLVTDAFTHALSLRAAATGKEVCRYGSDHSLLAWSPDGERLVFDVRQGEDRHCLRVVKARTAAEVWRREGWAAEAWYSGDGKVLGYHELGEATVHLLDAERGTLLHSFRPPAGQRDRYAFQAVSADLTRVAWREMKANTLEVWDKSGQRLWRWRAPESWTGGWEVRFVAGGRCLAAGCPSYGEEGAVYVLAAHNGEERHVFRGGRGSVLAASADGRYLVLGGKDRIEVREVQSGRRVLVREDHAMRCHSFTFSADGGRLAYSSDDYTVEVWELPAGKLRDKLHRPWYFISGLAFAPDGRSVAIGYNDSTVWLWAPSLKAEGK